MATKINYLIDIKNEISLINNKLLKKNPVLIVFKTGFRG